MNDAFARNLTSLNLDFYTTSDKMQYKSIFCQNEYRKLTPDFRKNNSYDCKYFLFKSFKDVDTYGNYFVKNLFK